MSKEKKELTEEIKQILNEAEAEGTRIYEDTRAKLRGAGMPISETGTRCYACDCASFVHNQSGPHTIKCQRSSCGHSWFRHDVY